MKYRSVSQLATEAPTVIVRAGLVDMRLIQDMIGFAFIKATDASSQSVSMLTRMDAAYDAILMFSLALFNSNGFHVSANPRDDRFAFEGMAYVLKLPDAAFTDILKLSRWPLRKYTEGLNVSGEFLADVLRSVRIVIKHVNVWWQRVISEKRSAF